MERSVYSKLLEWRCSPARKPLLLKGARQTGKTWVLKDLGLREFRHCAYCNFEEDPLLDSLFSGSLRPADVVPRLATHTKTPMIPGETLLVFDEIQLSNSALNSLKYFSEEMPQLHVAAAGSLLGLRVSGPRSFPVGKVTMLDLFPLTFLEFLAAVGESALRDMLQSIAAIESIPDAFHRKLTELLRVYYVVGGMPEAVAAYAGARALDQVRAVQRSILNTFVLDFAKHAPAHDVPRLGLIWEQLPTYLARENKKFVFSALARGARARDYESALQWLSDAALVHRSYAVELVQQPIAGAADRSAFKVFSLDVGLLAAQARIPVEAILNGDELFTTYRGAFVENYVAQQLVAHMGEESGGLYYWRSASRQAEVDFLVPLGGSIVPLEAKAGVNPKSKSLAAYRERFSPRLCLRTTLLNLVRQGTLVNIPLYAIGLLPHMAAVAAHE